MIDHRDMPGSEVGSQPVASTGGNGDYTARPGRVMPRPPLLSSSRVGATNRSLIIQALYDQGPTSRAALARSANVNRTTISGIVQPLIDSGWLIEGKPEPASKIGGKPARPLWFAPDAQPICGVLLMPQFVHACVVTLDGRILTDEQISLPSGNGPTAAILEVIERCIAQTIARSERAPAGIGVAVGGMVDTDTGSIVQINLAPALDTVPLAGLLAERFALPVRIDHHPRALLIGDRWFGQGRARRRFATIYTGEVLGGAFYIDGQLYRGSSGAGGELGHTFVQLGGEPCRCGRHGCWDTIATLSWLRKAAAVEGLPGAATIDSASLAALIEQGLEGAEPLRERYARHVAVGIANLQQTLALDHFIVHGDVVLGGAPMIAAITRHARAMLPDRAASTLEILMGDGTDRAALLGAAGLALSDLVELSI